MTKTNVPAPDSRWISITATYDTLTTKLSDATASKQDKYVAIDYWIARLKEDKQSIKDTGSPRTYP